MNGTDFIIFEGLKVTRYNKTVFAIKGGVNIVQDFGEEWSIQMDVWRSKLGNNQWVLTPLKVPKSNTIVFLKNVYVPSMQDDFKDTTNLPYYKSGEKLLSFKGVNNYKLI